MKIPVSNTTKMPIYVGATMIPPGETFHFEELDVPAHLRPEKPAEPEAPPPPDPLAEVLAVGVEKIKAQFRNLSTEQLQQLNVMERKAAMPRKSLLAAIDEELLDRAIEDEDARKAQS